MKISILRHSAFLCFSVLLLLSFVSCEKTVYLPTGGYDYTLCDGVLLGYPIPRRGEQFVLSKDTSPKAFVPTQKDGRYTYPSCEIGYLSLWDDMSVPYAAHGGARVWFRYEDDDLTVFQGSVDGCAVVYAEEHLMLCGDGEIRTIAEHCDAVLDCHENRILFSDDGRLCEYRGGKTQCLYDDAPVSDAWYVIGDADDTLLFCREDGLVFSGTENGPFSPCMLQTPAPDEKMTIFRGTAYALCGTDGDAYFYHLLTGEPVELNMGGLFRFPDKAVSIKEQPLSPDGVFAYFYDINYVYRIAFADGTSETAENNALIYENRCVLSSLTAVTDEMLLLSQAGNEMTEYNAVITPAAFAEDVPEEREDDFRP